MKTIENRLNYRLNMDLEKFIDELFWDDKYLYQSSCNGLWYIQDSYNGLWYSLENRYDYCNFANLFFENDTRTVSFYLIDDKEILEELENEFF